MTDIQDFEWTWAISISALQVALIQSILPQVEVIERRINLPAFDGYVSYRAELTEDARVALIEGLCAIEDKTSYIGGDAFSGSVENMIDALEGMPEVEDMSSNDTRLLHGLCL